MIDFSDILDNREEGHTKLRQIQLVQLRLLRITDRICKKYNIQYWLDYGTLIGAVRHQGFIPWDDDIDISMTREDYKKFLEIAPRELPNDIFLQTAQSDPRYTIYNVPLKLRDKYSTMVEFEGEDCHQGIFLDIFPYDKIPTDSKMQKKQIRLYKTLITGYEQNFPLKYRGDRFWRKKILQFFYKFYPKNKVERKIFQMYKNTDTYLYRPNLASKSEDNICEESMIFPLTEIEFEGEYFPVPNDYDGFLRIIYGDYMKLPPKESQRPLHAKFSDPFTHCKHHKDVLIWKNR